MIEILLGLVLLVIVLANLENILALLWFILLCLFVLIGGILFAPYWIPVEAYKLVKRKLDAKRTHKNS